MGRLFFFAQLVYTFGIYNINSVIRSEPLYMKKIVSLLILIAVYQSVSAQITITDADMPVVGDTLRYSFASPTGSGITLSTTGAGVSWNYTFMPIGQAVDTYQTALSVNPLYAFTIGFSAYGYKVADSSPIPIPLPGAPSIQQIYTFFEKRTSMPLGSRFQAEAFAAIIGGIPAPINYTTPDVWYFFPLSYTDHDSANFELNIALPGFGSIKQAGVRSTLVDGWGTITTPFYTTPANCIRVRSVIREIDSVQFGSFPAIGIPRTTVEYKWLVNGEHYPALWVTANMGPGGEMISNIRYRDHPMPGINNHVPVVADNMSALNAYPNPATGGIVNIDVPATWGEYKVEVFDIQSKLVASFNNAHELNLVSLPAGQYLARIVSGTNTGYAHIVR